MGNDKVRHILSISGGKDSAALAIYMRDRVPNMEYVFCDTEKELPETYDYLGRLEAILGKPIITLKDPSGGFDHWLKIFGNYLPSARTRWCTKHLKLFPFERYIGDSLAISYVGIRADEHRAGYIPTKPNIKPAFPFKEHGLCYSDIVGILTDAGLGLPSYYKWRSRSGCYFCFFQQKIEWVGLLEHHPDLFKLACNYEKVDKKTGKRFTWCAGESLEELSRAARIAEIKMEYQQRIARDNLKRATLAEVLELENEQGLQPCLICTL